jgi:hypothetical protein
MDNKAALKYLQSVVKDTSTEMLLAQQEMWQKFSDEKKLMLTMELMDTNMQLLEAGIRNSHPEWNNEEVRTEILGALYRNRFSEKEFGLLLKLVREYHQKNS